VPLAVSQDVAPSRSWVLLTMVLDVIKNIYYIACIMMQTVRLQREQHVYNIFTTCEENILATHETWAHVHPIHDKLGVIKDFTYTYTYNNCIYIYIYIYNLLSPLSSYSQNYVILFPDEMCGTTLASFNSVRFVTRYPILFLTIKNLENAGF